MAVLPHVEKFVKEYDIRLEMHNHGPHDPEWTSPFDIERVINSMDHRIGYCIDIGHTLRIGVDPVARSVWQVRGSTTFMFAIL